MPVRVRCPNVDCDGESSLADEDFGKLVRCPRCGAKFSVAPSSSSFEQGGPRPESNTTITWMAPGEGYSLVEGQTDGELPARIGRVEVRGRLGSGAVGAVYLAFDPQLEREVALKVPHEGRLRTADDVERFLDEARASARLRHPKIVPVFEVGRDGDRPFIASAYVAGETLSQILAAGGLGSIRHAARIVKDLAEALAYTHGLGIVHRDIKPDNVLIDTRGTAHLMDFGLAQRRDADDLSPRSGIIAGTPAYMSPEQARGEEARPASDQYGLGVVLFELLCGRTPFTGTTRDLLRDTISTAPASPRSLNSAVPRELEAICLKTLSKPPDSRYSNCSAMARDLRDWLKGKPGRRRADDRRAGEPPPTISPQSGRRALGWTVVVVVVFILIDLVAPVVYLLIEVLRRTNV